MLTPHTIALHVYAESDEEAKILEADLLEFVKKKYNNGIYPRAASMSRLIRQYGDTAIVNAFIK
jgi:hypothetical protein